MLLLLLAEAGLLLLSSWESRALMFMLPGPSATRQRQTPAFNLTPKNSEAWEWQVTAYALVGARSANSTLQTSRLAQSQ